MMKPVLLLAALLTAPPAWAAPAGPARYNVVWDSPSTGSVDSMPLAGGILGLNVWVEDNDLLFLIGSPNCLNEDGMQTKLGCVRIHFTPTAFAKNFRQELNLERSDVTVSGQTLAAQPVMVRLWCDVFQPVIHVGIASGERLEAVVSYETWSNYEARLVEGGFQWVRRLDPAKDRRARDMKAQGMTEFASAIPDPLANLTEGGRLLAPGMEPAGPRQGKFHGMSLKTCSVKTTKPVTNLDLCFALRMEQDKTLPEWESQLALSAKQAAANPAEARAASLAWWGEFWNRSHIAIRPGALPADKAWQAGRNYQLIRYQLAANHGGRAMTLFNGGVFPCTGNPDSRQWDFCQFMAQNQRLVYWPMLRAGDYDLLKVALDFYRDRTEMSRLHAKKFWGVDGVAWSEPFSVFGLDAIGTRADGRSSPRHLNYHYTSGMEFALMMLEFGRYTGQDITGYLPAPEGIIAYYDQFYQKACEKRTGKRLDNHGRLVIYPSDALEIYHGCSNNTDVIAGLTALTRELLALPSGAISPASRAYLEGFHKRIPALPIKEKDGKKYLAGAESWEWIFHNGNMEFPQMYVCFPFNILSLGRSDISLAKNTWDLGAAGNPAVQKQNQCWYQSAINFARMGDTALAAKWTVEKLLHPGARFPTFYRTHYAGGQREFCHLPDTDHGGAAMLALQEMLMQTDGKRILLGPAWPADWDCDFKLHAPYQTTVEGRVLAGKVVVDKVTPKSRRADLEIFPLKATPAGPVPAINSSASHASVQVSLTFYTADAEGSSQSGLEEEVPDVAGVARRAEQGGGQGTIEAADRGISWCEATGNPAGF